MYRVGSGLFDDGQCRRNLSLYGLGVSAVRAFLRCDPHHVGQRPGVAHLDGDYYRLRPHAAGRGDDRRPGEDSGGDDVRGQRVGDGGVQVHVAGVGDAEGVGQPRPRLYRVGSGLFGHRQSGRELVGPDIVAHADGARFTINVHDNAHIHACINCRAVGTDVIVPRVGVHKVRVAPDVDRAGEDGACASPIGSIGPSAITP